MSDIVELPIRKFSLELAAPVVDERAALDGWHAMVRAYGWSPLHGAEVVETTTLDTGEFLGAVVGRVYEHPGLKGVIESDTTVIGVAVAKPRWADLFGIAPNFTGDRDAGEFLDDSRGEA